MKKKLNADQQKVKMLTEQVERQSKELDARRNGLVSVSKDPQESDPVKVTREIESNQREINQSRVDIANHEDALVTCKARLNTALLNHQSNTARLRELLGIPQAVVR